MRGYQKRSRNLFLHKLSLEPLEDRRLLSVDIGDFVWNDLDGNGIQDVGEPGVAGVVVEIYSSTDGVIGNADDVSHGIAETDDNGNYSFIGLPDGLSYYEVFRAPIGFTFTTKDAGSDNALDCDADTTGVTAIFTVSDGQTDTTMDAGLVGASPSFAWAGKLGGAGYDNGKSIAVAADGSVYISGYFADAVDFDLGPGIYNLTSSAIYNRDIYVAKYSPVGSLHWARKMGGSGNDYGYSIAVAADGSVYTTGRFQGTVDFDPGPGTYNLDSAGSTDIFISKLDSAGNFAWARRLGGTSRDYGYSIALAADGSVYTTGSFQGTADFDPGTGIFNLTSAGYDDIFISKLTSSGNFVWAGRMGGTSADVGNSIAVATDGSVYTTGYFEGMADFDPGTSAHNLASAGSWDIFVSKLDSSGNYVWARRMGGSKYNYGRSIAVADDGSVYTTGYFEGIADFDPGIGIFNLSCTGNFGTFISKLNSSGNFVWARSLDASYGDSGYSIAVTDDGNVYTTGAFQGTADFDPGAGVYNLTSVGNSDIFVSKLDTAGNFVMAWGMGGTGDDYGCCIAVSSDGSNYTTGYFQGTGDFDPSAGTFNLTSSGYDDIFIAKLIPNRAPTDIALSANSIVEHLPIGTIVGSFSSVDPDSDAAIAYTLVSGSGGEDNAAFTIEAGGNLKSAAAFDFEIKSSYHIRVRTVDYTGMCYDEAFEILVTNIPEIRTWDGGSLVNNLWTTKENWVGDIAPLSSDSLIFPTGAARLDNVNDLPPGTVFDSITVSGVGYCLHNAGAPATSVQVNPGTQLEIDKIVAGRLTIGAGAKVTIRPIVTRTWDGGSLIDNLWTTKENWVGDVAPSSGDNLLFPVGAARLVNVNDYSPDVAFGSITVAGSGYCFNNGITSTTNIQVQPGQQLETDKIITGTLTIGAGAKVTIRPIVTTRTWDGGGANNLWTTKENWVGDVAPKSGDNLVFPAGVAQLESVNDYPTATVFGSITVSGSGYCFHNGCSTTTSVQVQAGKQLETDKIVTGTLTIGAGAKVTIRPIITDFTWDGGGADNLWTTKENWVGDVAPKAGDKLVFPAGATKLNSVNDYPAGTAFGSITVSGSGYCFNNGVQSTANIEVQAGKQLEADKIVAGTLTIGAGAKVTISPISSGQLSQTAIKSVAAVPEAADAIKPATVAMPAENLFPADESSLAAIINRLLLQPINLRIRDLLFSRPEHETLLFPTVAKLTLDESPSTPINHATVKALNTLHEVKDVTRQKAYSTQEILPLSSAWISNSRSNEHDNRPSYWQWLDALDITKRRHNLDSRQAVSLALASIFQW
jgi:hypothetical protein